MDYQISFVVAPPHLVKLADEILKRTLRCNEGTRKDIRTLAKAYIDEADELNRSAREVENNAENIQIQSLSPPEMVERARKLATVLLSNKSQQEDVRKIAQSYVLIAEKNQEMFDEFMKNYGDKLPPQK